MVLEGAPVVQMEVAQVGPGWQGLRALICDLGHVAQKGEALQAAELRQLLQALLQAHAVPVAHAAQVQRCEVGEAREAAK
jgi:hypothetical protein